MSESQAISNIDTVVQEGTPATPPTVVDTPTPSPPVDDDAGCAATQPLDVIEATPRADSEKEHHPMCCLPPHCFPKDTVFSSSSSDKKRSRSRSPSVERSPKRPRIADEEVQQAQQLPVDDNVPMPDVVAPVENLPVISEPATPPA